MAGPLGRRGSWHKFLSRYNIVVVYKLGVENDAADGLSRWAYQAGLANGTNFQGSDANLEGITQWEASERKKEQRLIAANQYPCKRAPKGRPSPQDMQEQRRRDYPPLQVNRLHSSLHYDSSSLLVPWPRGIHPGKPESPDPYPGVVCTFCLPCSGAFSPRTVFWSEAAF